MESRWESLFPADQGEVKLGIEVRKVVLLILSQPEKELGLELGEGMLPLLPLLLLQLVLLPLPLVVLVQWVPNLLLYMLLLNQQDHLLLLRVLTPDLRLALAFDLTLLGLRKGLRLYVSIH